MVELTICAECESEFDADCEGDEGLCAECYMESHFRCAWCEAYAEEVDQEAYVVVFEASGTGVRLPGLYRVTDLPYYCQGMIGGGFLFACCVEWVGFLPTMADDGYPCGHLCKACQGRAVAWIADDHTRCGMLAALG